jgi:thiamine biosynthesis lipoprotein
MRKIKMKGWGLLCCISLTGWGQAFRFQETRPKMGSPFGIAVYHTDSAYARQAVDAAFGLVDSLNLLYSDYDSAAWAWKLSEAPAGVWLPVPAPMLHMLVECRRAASRSYGSFDITIGALTRFWRQQRRTGIFPPDSAVAAMRVLTGWKWMELDPQRNSVRKRRAGVRLDFGGIAKGAIAWEVMLFLQRQGIASVMVDAGGDIACGAPPPGKAGWQIAVNRPEEEDTWQRPLVLQQQAVATSGNMYQAWEYQGIRYSHIIDPATGYGSTRHRNVTVLAADGATADWLATAFSILPIRRCSKLARKMHAEYFIAALEGEKIISYRSPGFPALQ